MLNWTLGLVAVALPLAGLALSTPTTRAHLTLGAIEQVALAALGIAIGLTALRFERYGILAMTQCVNGLIIRKSLGHDRSPDDPPPH